MKFYWFTFFYIFSIISFYAGDEDQISNHFITLLFNSHFSYQIILISIL